MELSMSQASESESRLGADADTEVEEMDRGNLEIAARLESEGKVGRHSDVRVGKPDSSRSGMLIDPVEAQLGKAPLWISPVMGWARDAEGSVICTFGSDRDTETGRDPSKNDVQCDSGE